MPEPTREQLQAQRTAELHARLWNDTSEVGASYRKKAKEFFPEITIPDEQLKPFVAPLESQLAATKAELDEIRKERAAEKSEREDNRIRRTLEEAVTQARDKFSLTDDGAAKMLDRMKATGNYSDAEAAAAWVAQQTPPAPPPGPSWAPKSMNLYGTKEADDRFKMLHRDPAEFMDQELQRFVANPDAYMREDA
jgi:hypothetical protein